MLQETLNTSARMLKQGKFTVHTTEVQFVCGFKDCGQLREDMNVQLSSRYIMTILSSSILIPLFSRHVSSDLSARVDHPYFLITL